MDYIQTTYSEETKKFLSRLRHPSLRIARVLLSPVRSNTITICISELADMDVRLYHYDDGVTLYEAVAWVDDVNGDTKTVTVCATENSSEAKEKIYEFYHRMV